MAAKKPARNAVAVSDIAMGILDPVLRKRAGMSIDLVQSWPEIAGERLAVSTRPERIVWPRRAHEDDPFEPATLVIACEGAAALRLQHETPQIVSRVNAFLGFVAIGRIKIVQKRIEMGQSHRPPSPRPLTKGEEARISTLTGAVEDEGLRAALQRLGASVIGSRKK